MGSILVFISFIGLYVILFIARVKVLNKSRTVEGRFNLFVLYSLVLFFSMGGLFMLHAWLLQSLLEADYIEVEFNLGGWMMNFFILAELLVSFRFIKYIRAHVDFFGGRWSVHPYYPLVMNFLNMPLLILHGILFYEAFTLL